MLRADTDAVRLGQIVGVDPKTVSRWVAVGGWPDATPP
jgi:hypothetical protein